MAQVSVIGGELPEYQVLVEQEKLRLFGLTVQDVADAAAAARARASQARDASSCPSSRCARAISR